MPTPTVINQHITLDYKPLPLKYIMLYRAAIPYPKRQHVTQGHKHLP